jgi:hypothetical protein
MGKSFPLTKILQDGWNHQPVWISQMNNGYGMIYGFLQKLGVFSPFYRQFNSENWWTNDERIEGYPISSPCSVFWEWGKWSMYHSNITQPLGVLYQTERGGDGLKQSTKDMF